MYTIRKEFHFSASHQLDHLPEGHQCARLHGHNYVVIVELQAPTLDGDGFVLDYGELARFKSYIDATLDHRHLNTVFGSGLLTTAENLARALFDVLALEYVPAAVTVQETPKTSAEYRPSYPNVMRRKTSETAIPWPPEDGNAHG